MYSQQRLIEKELNIAQKTNFDGWLKGYKKELLPNFVFQLVNILTKVLMYGFAVMRAASGMLTPGEVIAFALYFENISTFSTFPTKNTRVLFPPKSGMTTNMSLNSDTFGSNIPTAKNMC